MEIYQVDAFCDNLFSGNPAAVCPVESWPDDQLLQNIAAENNLAETAFYLRDKDRFHIRWFTPAVEVDLCGHATLAAAHVLFEHKGFTQQTVIFTSRSGELRVQKNEGQLTLDFPADNFKELAPTEGMQKWFGAMPIQVFKGKTDYMLVFPAESDIRNIKPNMDAIAQLTDARGVIVTAKGDGVDFVSRFFAPQSGIFEDPVTGSAHTTLAPYWSSKLGKTEMTAVQLSRRKGFLQCKLAGNRVLISGKARTFLEGKLHL